ncbi:hypothetical protein PIROE2DRAFT_58145 [Piromyces sp. E2]|nr:hypothetical protein PIROE2DRAFT_58145 [Piromyces sp. E2]|eukprot:OUM68390.1 hypothetical protein PIROE2DRAFT_58145 [Piromyces sp. E2]
MDSKLLIQAITKFFFGVILIGLLIFMPAWTVTYWQGWLLMGVLFIPMFLAGLVMFGKSPELLERRLSSKEKEEEQKTVVRLSGIMFLAAFIVAGLNYRFKWIELPTIIPIMATVVFLIGYVLYAEVLRENTYLSRTIEVHENQKVIDTGLYGIVRHPMYMSTLILFFAMPLILGSLLSFFIMLVYIPIINKRLKNEEKVLEANLIGYQDYMKKVKYRVIPFVW